MSETVPEYVVGGIPLACVAKADPWALLARLVEADENLLRQLGTLPTYVDRAAKAQAAAMAKAKDALEAAR